MRTSDIRFSSTETSNTLRYPIQFMTFPNQSQSIYYPAQVALHLSPNQLPSGSHLSNNMLYPAVYQIGHQQLMLNSNPRLVISLPCAPTNMSDNNNMTSQSSVDSHMSLSVTSPTSLGSASSQLSINYSLSKWNEISSFFDGIGEIRPSAGQLRNGKYFTQRSAGKDIYMVFNSKSDYINNFVNYYFSNKNFSTDEKLFNLMDDCGNVALRDLMMFPRLAQIGTTIDDIVEALKFSNFVTIVTFQNESKSIRRSDGWFPTKLIDESQKSVAPHWVTPVESDRASYKQTNSDSYRNIINNNNNLPPSNHIVLDSTVVSVPQADSTSAAPSNTPLIYFNQQQQQQHQQSMYAAAGAAGYAVHGLHQASGGYQGAGHTQQLILSPQAHYTSQPFFQHPQQPPQQLRPLWQQSQQLYGPPLIGTGAVRQPQQIIGSAASTGNHTNHQKQY